VLDVWMFQASAVASLLYMSPMNPENGPPLPLGEQLHRTLRPKSFHTVMFLRPR
jgi:hypothetical protein